MKDNGGPAFPVKAGMWFMAPPGTDEQYAAFRKDIEQEYEGMSLRDWFAGMALKGLLAGSNVSCGLPGYAADAFLFADAMIAERNKEVENEHTE